MTIQILGSGCAKCNELEGNAREVTVDGRDDYPGSGSGWGS